MVGVVSAPDGRVHLLDEEACPVCCQPVDVTGVQTMLVPAAVTCQWCRWYIETTIEGDSHA